MASFEQMDDWNHIDIYGQIEPPLSKAEADMFEAYGVGPDSMIAFKTYRNVARVALIQCAHIRTPGRPEIAAAELARHKES